MLARTYCPVCKHKLHHNSCQSDYCSSHYIQDVEINENISKYSFVTSDFFILVMYDKCFIRVYDRRNTNNYFDLPLQEIDFEPTVLHNLNEKYKKLRLFT